MHTSVVRSEEEIHTAVLRLSTATALGCDTETSGLNPRTGRLFSIQFSDGDHNVLVPLSEGVPLASVAQLLEDPAVVKIFHNARFDLEFLIASGVPTANVFDTMLAERVLTRGADQSASLAETLYRYFAVDLDKSQRAKFNRNWNGVWTDELVRYALADVVHLPRLMYAQQDWLTRLGLSREFEEVQRRALARHQTVTNDDKRDGLR